MYYTQQSCRKSRRKKYKEREILCEHPAIVVRTCSMMDGTMVANVFRESLQTNLIMLERLRRTPQVILRELHLLYVIIQFAVIKVLHWVLFWIPSQKKKIVAVASKRAGMDRASLHVDQWQDSIVSLQSYLSLCRSITLDTRKLVHAGGPAYDSGLLTLDGKPGRLLDYQQGLRPLVAIFGSCT